MLKLKFQACKARRKNKVLSPFPIDVPSLTYTFVNAHFCINIYNYVFVKTIKICYY